MTGISEQVHKQITAILDQGAEAVKQVVDAYVENRTYERDMNWLCLQMAKEFGAVIIHTDYAREAICAGTDGRAVDKYIETVREEVAHYQAYFNLLNRTIGENTEIPVPDIYNYLLTRVENGKLAPDEKMAAMAERWPEHHKYMACAAPYIKNQHPWVGKIFASTMEGAAGGWHWCMSQVPPQDDFLSQVARLQKGIAIDELEHGPEALAALCAEYSEDFGVNLDDLYLQLREHRYQEVRQRNEQFLHPLNEAQLETIHQQLLDDTLTGFKLYSKVA
jgi:hypothetical protein